MNKTSCRTLPILCIALVIAFLVSVSGVATAQDVYNINYFSNADPLKGAPYASVRVSNPGRTYANLCAMVYVYDNDQQLTECCGCIETPNGLRTFNFSTDLNSNALTGTPSDNGVIKVVSAPYSLGCDPTAAYKVAPNLRAWATHIQDFTGTWPITETAFSDSPISTAELAALQTQCKYAWLLGSGKGVCKCGTGD